MAWQGIVLIRCDGCDKLHLIADNLGWFDNLGKNIESIAAQLGRHVEKLHLSPADRERLRQLHLNAKATGNGTGGRAAVDAAALAPAKEPHVAVPTVATPVERK